MHIPSNPKVPLLGMGVWETRVSQHAQGNMLRIFTAALVIAKSGSNLNVYQWDSNNVILCRIFDEFHRSMCINLPEKDG